MSQVGPPEAGAGRDPDRRRAVLAAADRVIAAQGAGASMMAIARAAGVTKPVLYRHFGDKDGLYRALAERHTERLLTDLRAALATRGTLRQRTEATIGAYLGVIEAEPQMYRFLLARLGSDGEEVSLFVRRVGAVLAAGIAIEVGEAEVGAAAQIWAHAIVGMVRGAGDWWLDLPPTQRPARAEVVDRLSDLLFGELPARAGSVDPGSPGVAAVAHVGRRR